MSKYFDINMEGHSIKCRLYSPNNHSIEKLVVFGHGFGGHMDNRCAEHFSEKVLKHASVLVFNWPCHGNDIKKKITLEDCMTYMQLIFRHMSEVYGVKEFYGYGTSFGAYLFLTYIAAHGNPFVRCALRCPAIDMYPLMTDRIMNSRNREMIEMGKETEVGFDRLIKIGPPFLEELRANDITQNDYIDYADDLIILHGNADEIVPIESARKFAEDNVIEFYEIDGADHRFRDIAKMADAEKIIIRFFDLNH